MFELRESLEEAYRPSPYAQLALFISLEVILLLGIWALKLSFPESYVVFLFITALLYSTIVRVRTMISELITMILFGAAISTTAFYLIYTFVLKPTGVNLLNLWLVIVFLLVLGLQTFHYVFEKARTVKTKSTLIFNAILTTIFAFAVWNILNAIVHASQTIVLLATIVISIAYFAAIFPEKPF